MLKKPERPTRDRNTKIPNNISDLTKMYDLDNKKIYDYLDYLVDYINGGVNNGTEGN